MSLAIDQSTGLELRVLRKWHSIYIRCREREICECLRELGINPGHCPGSGFITRQAFIKLIDLPHVEVVV